MESPLATRIKHLVPLLCCHPRGLALPLDAGCVLIFFGAQETRGADLMTQILALPAEAKARLSIDEAWRAYGSGFFLILGPPPGAEKRSLVRVARAGLQA